MLGINILNVLKYLKDDCFQKTTQTMWRESKEIHRAQDQDWRLFPARTLGAVRGTEASPLMCLLTLAGIRSLSVQIKKHLRISLDYSPLSPLRLVQKKCNPRGSLCVLHISRLFSFQSPGSILSQHKDVFCSEENERPRLQQTCARDKAVN